MIPPMRANSLALRLFLSATAWTVVILLVTGFVLSALYRDAVERAFDRRLGVYLRTWSPTWPRPTFRSRRPARRSASRCSSCRCRAGTGR